MLGFPMKMRFNPPALPPMTLSLSFRAALLAAVIFGVAACDRPASSDAGATPTPTPEAEGAKPEAPGVGYGDGFHKEEVNPTATIRWVRRDAALSVSVPAAGRYRLTFKPFTVFSTTENTIEVNVNGQGAGSFSTRAFDVANPVPTILPVTLRAGGNAVRLHSRGAEIKLGESDDRMAAYGLVVPPTVDPAP